MRFIQAVLLVAVFMASSEAKTRRRMLPAALMRNPRFFYDVDEKIVGGSPAVDGQFPSQVSFQDSSSNFHFCGGSILNPTTIITAAHCVAGENFDNPQNLRIVAGHLQHNANAGQTSQVIRITQHESYSSVTLRNDIALLHLGEALQFDDNVDAVTLPSPGQDHTGTAIVSGWGTTSSGGSASPDLLFVEVPIVSDAECENSYPLQMYQTMICAGEAGKDSCQGDSGGPLYCGEGRLCGIVSWGRGCALEGYPGVYTETSHFVDWINNNA